MIPLIQLCRNRSGADLRVMVGATSDPLPLRESNFIVGIEKMPVVFEPRV